MHGSEKSSDSLWPGRGRAALTLATGALALAATLAGDAHAFEPFEVGQYRLGRSPTAAIPRSRM